MVKKSSFLDKIKDRFRSGSGIRVDETAGRRTRPQSNRTGTTSRRTTSKPVNKPDLSTEPNPVIDRIDDNITPKATREPAVPAMKPTEKVSNRKISTKEDAVARMNESFAELANLLRGVQVRLEDQGESLARLPVHGAAQLEVLKGLAAQLERQNQTQEKLAGSLGELPQAVNDMRTALDKVNATETRTVETIGDFRKTMDRIHSAMGEMVEGNKASGVKMQEDRREIVGEMKKAQTEAVDRLETSNRESLKSLRMAQEDQANRMLRMADENNKRGRIVVGLLAAAVIALTATCVALLAS